MQALNFKPELSGPVRQPSGTALPLLSEQEQGLTETGEAASLVTKPVLLLERLTGAVLGGAATTALVGNVLVCIAMLLLGPAFIIEMLVKINGM